MSKLVLGLTPDSLDLRLTRDADFVAGLDSEDGDWPTGATISLAFDDPDDTVWPATIVAAAADWNVDKAEVNTLLDSQSRLHARLLYTDGGTELTWASGLVTGR